jgi:hypothetical protein
MRTEEIAFKVTLKFSDDFPDTVETWSTREAAERAIKWYEDVAPLDIDEKGNQMWTVVSAEIEEINE